MRVSDAFKKVSRALRQRQMFWRILALYLLGSVILLAAFSAVLTRMLTQRAINDMTARNRDAMSQAFSMADYILNTTYDSYYKLYQSYEATTLMFSPELTPEDALVVERMFQRMDCASDCVDSIYLINRIADRVYASNGRISSLDDFFDGQAVRLFRFYSANSDTLFLPRTFSFTDESNVERQYAYISLIFSRRDAYQIPAGGIIVNIDETALIGKIAGSIEMPDNFYIVSENGSILANANSQRVNTSTYGSPLWEQVVAHRGEGYFSFTEEFSGQDCLVTGYSAPRLRFYFLCMTPVEYLRGSVVYIRNIILLCAAVFLLIAFLMAGTASRWIYRPISRLVTKVRNQTEPDEPDAGSSALSPPVDEITFLRDTYQGLYNKVETLSRDHDALSRRNVLLNLFYGEYLSENSCRREAERVGIPSGRAMRVIVLLFDDYGTFSRERSAYDLALYRYGIINMAEELLSPLGPVFSVENKADQVTILLCPDSDAEEEKSADGLREALQTLEAAVLRYIHHTVSCGIGAPVTQFSDLVSSYNGAMTASEYRLVFGRGAVIPFEDIAMRQTITPEYPLEDDGTIVQALRNRNMSRAAAGLDAFFSVYSLANVDAINMATTQLTISLSRTAHSIAAGHEGTRQLPNYRVLSGLVESKDTLQERKAVLEGYCEQVIEIRNGEAETQKEDLIERVKAFIETNYANPMLDTKDIAAFAELSPNYLRTLFKKAVGKSPTDYLTECRLNRACDLLLGTDTPTKEIAAAVGYYNHRYFYSVFKAKMGMTATAFRSAARGSEQDSREEEDSDEEQ